MQDAREVVGTVVDLDLDKEDAALREAIGQPTRIKVHGEVIEIEHPSLWSTTAMKAVNGGDWLEWGREVITDPDQFSRFKDFNLRNYQYEAIFARLSKDAGTDLGKSSQPAVSSNGTRTT